MKKKSLNNSLSYLSESNKMSKVLISDNHKLKTRLKDKRKGKNWSENYSKKR